MKRVCCSGFHVGNRYFGDKEPFNNEELTHGFCPGCMALELQKIEEQLDEIQGRDLASPSAL